MTRDCLNSGSWGSVNTTYCLPKYPEKGYANVDFVIYVMHGRIDTISENPEGIVVGFAQTSKVVEESTFSVHRIAQNTQSDYVSVQIRVTDIESRANSFYKQLDEAFLEEVLRYLVENNSERKKYYYLSQTDGAHLSFKPTPSYQTAKPQNTTAIVVIVVCVIIAVIVLVIVGFYVWLQIKRSSSKNGSKQLKNTSKV